MLGNKVHDFLNSVIIHSEHQNEFLFGDCQSSVNLSNTQEHILMVLSNERLTNSELADLLGVSQAAITKAIKALLADGFLVSKRDDKDARVLYYEPTSLAKKIAEEHRQHHDSTVEVYNKLLDDFNFEEQRVISDFIDKMEEVLSQL